MNSDLYVEKTKHKYIYNICHFDNVKSVLENGILSFNKAKRMSHVSIAFPEIQDRRDKKRVPNGYYLHDYANCFFNPRNSMLYCKQQSFDQICVICVDVDVLNLNDVVLSDMNAATKTAAFYPVEMGLEKLNFEKIFAKDWNLPDESEKCALKRILSAEVLVPFKIDAKYIKKIYVNSESAKHNLQQIVGDDVLIEINKYLFFDVR